MSATPSSADLQRPDVPFRDTRFGPVDVELLTRADGTLLLNNTQPLNPYPVRHMGEHLRRHAAATPTRTFIAEPDGRGGWRTIDYATALARANGLAQWLLERGLPAGRPLMILSENSIPHALLQLAAMQVGIPVLAISSAYSLMSEDCARVVELARRFQPSLVYAGDGIRYRRALGFAKSACDTALLLCDTAPPGLAATLLDEAAATQAGARLEAAFAAVGPDTIGRLLLTSGSTGAPKAVIVTQGNMLAAGMVWDQSLPFLTDKPPVIVDWLPWSHTAGVNGAFNAVLRHGGTLYIDDGKPVPKLFERSIAALREVKPDIMFNVPIALDMLVARMDEDPALADAVFANLQAITYGGAALSHRTLVKLEQHSARATGARIPISTSLGSTETNQPATLVWWPQDIVGTIGLPAPGVRAKLIPDGDRYEIRFRGANITPGYFNDPAATAAAFDEEGFLKTGDAVAFADPQAPLRGLVYAGRMSENFKLSTGTWVTVSHVREAVLGYARPLVHDLVFTGHDRARLGALVFLNEEQARKDFPELAQAAIAEIVRHPALHRRLRAELEAYNAKFPGLSTRLARVLLLERGPSVADGELTDKGYINQRGVLKMRPGDVLRLDDEAPDDARIVMD